MTATNIGNYIREKREQKGWSQEHLAELVGVSQRTIHSWENSKVANIKLCNLKNIANAFEVSELEVFHGKDMPELDSNTKEHFGQDLLPVLEVLEERSLLALEIGAVTLGWTIFALSLVLWTAIPQNLFSSILLFSMASFGVFFSVWGRHIIIRKPRKTRTLHKDAQTSDTM